MVRNEIINECLDFLISKLEEDILCDRILYGKFSFYIWEDCHQIIMYYCDYITKNGEDHITKLETFDFDRLQYPKIKYFWHNKNKKEDLTRKNKIYMLLRKRYKELILQGDIENNKALISCLPEDRQKQIYRESKLNRIIDEN